MTAGSPVGQSNASIEHAVPSSGDVLLSVGVPSDGRGELQRRPDKGGLALSDTGVATTVFSLSLSPLSLF